MSRWTQWMGVCALAVSMVVHAEVIPVAGGGDSRIRTADYSAGEVYRLFGFVGYDIGLEFAKDETFKRVNGGDLKSITYSAQENVFNFKPRVRSARTNITITTNKRRYYIEYSATDVQPDIASGNVIYVVRFVYPPELEPALTPSERIDAALTQAGRDRPRNFDYWFCGDPSLKPVGAFDDGVQMHLRFAPRAELPAVFLKNDDGSESLVNFTVSKRDLIIHRVTRQLVLRRGKLVGCVVNKSFSGAGDLLESGTVSGDVERVSRGGAR